jgi:DNA-binding response OmpR family regulator
LSRAQSHSILIVEDEPSIASFVAMYLKRAGFAVRVAVTGENAIEQAVAEALDQEGHPLSLREDPT